VDDTAKDSVPLDAAALARPQGDEIGFTPAEITAGRLHLRPWQPTDVPALTAACQDTEIQRWTTVPVPYAESDAHEFITGRCPKDWADGMGTPFAVLDSTSGDLLASVGLLVRSRADGVMSVGYWTAPWARGGGVATQAVGTVCRWAFATLGTGRVEWTAYVGNDGSRRVAERAGFRFEGVARGRHLHRGQRVDAWVAALLATDLEGASRGPGPPRNRAADSGR
jgi:RimJ/RimL family protein N-acetyltransferase